MTCHLKVSLITLTRFVSTVITMKSLTLNPSVTWLCSPSFSWTCHTSQASSWVYKTGMGGPISYIGSGHTMSMSDQVCMNMYVASHKVLGLCRSRWSNLSCCQLSLLGCRWCPVPEIVQSQTWDHSSSIMCLRREILHDHTYIKTEWQ